MSKVRRLEKLAQKEEQNIVKRIVFLSFLSAIIILILFTVGIPFFGNLADFTDRFIKKDGNTESTDTTIDSPIINNLAEFTNKNNITVSGFSSLGAKVDIYVDGNKIGETSVEGGSFKYENLQLKDGENTISAKAVGTDGRESEFSQEQKIILDTKKPDLVVESPNEGQEFSGENRVKFIGETEPNAQVFAAGFLANVSFEGKFEVAVPLLEGENNIEVKAVDEAGNTNELKVKINFKK